MLMSYRSLVSGLRRRWSEQSSSLKKLTRKRRKKTVHSQTKPDFSGYPELENMWRRACYLGNDTEYDKLLKFEAMIVEHLRFNKLQGRERLAVHVVLGNVNSAQTLLLERQLGEDINGDGKVG